MQNIEMYRSQNLQNAYALADTINAWRRSNFRFQSTAVDYRGIIADKSSITAVTPQQLTPSPRYYRNVHRENPRYYRGYRSITAVPITVQLSSWDESPSRQWKHLLCSCHWQTSKKCLAAFKAFVFHCVQDDLCWDAAKCSQTKIVFCNTLDRKAINVEFCSNFSSASVVCRLAFLWANQFAVITDLFNVFDSHIFVNLKNWTSSLEKQ